MKPKFYLVAILFFTLNLFNFSVLADPAPSVPQFKHIVFFGDSLTDNGNLFKSLNDAIPKYPPYYNGRFTNGYNWSDLISYNLYSNYSIDAANYAVGGATAAFENPSDGYLPLTLMMECRDYELRNLLNSKDDTLYAIWIGANDYLSGRTDVDAATTNSVNAIVAVIKELAQNKNAQFLVVQLPDISLTPEARELNFVDNYKQLITMHNQKLHAAVIALRAEYPNVKIIEFSFIDHPVLRNIVESPTYREAINQKYNLDITDVTNSCWDGGYYANKPSVSAIQRTLNSTAAPAQNSQALAQQIASNPALMEAYRVGQMSENDAVVCSNPAQHVFWDHVHPTVGMHKVLAGMFLDTVLSNQ